MSQSDLRQKSEEYFKKTPLSEDKVGHTQAVADTAEKIAQRMKGLGIDVDPNMAYCAALLHEIGLVDSPSQTEKEEQDYPWPEHAVVGAQKARDAGFPEPIVAAIQNHAGCYNKSECDELKLPYPIVGETWTSNHVIAKVVQIADEAVVLVRHHFPSLDPWNDPKAHDIKDEMKTSEVEKMYKIRINKTVTKDHPYWQRVVKESHELYDEMLKYVKAEDVPPAWPGLSGWEPPKE